MPSRVGRSRESGFCPPPTRWARRLSEFSCESVRDKYSPASGNSPAASNCVKQILVLPHVECLLRRELLHERHSLLASPMISSITAIHELSRKSIAICFGGAQRGCSKSSVALRRDLRRNQLRVVRHALDAKVQNVPSIAIRRPFESAGNLRALRRVVFHHQLASRQLVPDRERRADDIGLVLLRARLRS